ncbi:MAG: CNNM domain-containing protein, partial [Nocardioidaceae bacterium]
MSGVDIWLLVIAAVLVVVAGLFSSADAALSSFSKARAEELASEGKTGATRLLTIVDDAPRYLNTALFLRLLCEIAAIVLVTVVLLDLIEGEPGTITSQEASQAGRWWAILASIGVMLIVSFVVVGVAPRTVGRQHAERVALLSAGVVMAFTKVLGPLPQLLILVGNAITPGRGFSEGPFASEAELRELVDLAEASSVIESGEREMIHS